MLVEFPLIKDVVALVGRTYGVQHIAVALRMHRLLEGLDVQAEIDFVCGDVFADVGQVRRLDGVEEDEETQHLVVRSAFGGRKRLAVVLDVLAEVDFFGYPEVVHRLSVPAAHPGVFEIVEVVEIGGVAANHTAFDDFGIAVFVEQWFEFEMVFVHKSSVFRFYFLI